METGKQLVVVCALLLTLQGCPLEQDGNDVSICVSGELPFHGCWVTQECSQLTDSNQQLLEKWARAQYRIDGQNIAIHTYSYDDASCSGAAMPLNDSGLPEVSYQFNQSAVQEDGLTAYQLTIALPAQESAVALSVDGLVVVTAEDQLCTSQQFYFGATRFAIAQGVAKETGMYENCLLRGTLP